MIDTPARGRVPERPADSILDEIERRRARLDRELAPGHMELVAELFATEHAYDTRRLLDILAAHLPGVAPAIHAIGRHANDDDPESGCCGLPPRRYGEDGPAA